MKVKKKSTLSWSSAPDVITPDDLSLITGLGIQSCRKLFDSPDFPSFSKKIIGNVGKADKEAVRLYLQGFNIKDKDKNALLMMIYQQLKLMNKTNTNDDEFELESSEI